MKKVTVLTVTGLLLASAAAYAQMNHGSSGRMHSQQSESHMGSGMMHGMMREHRGSHGGAMHGQESGHGGHSGAANAKPKGDSGPSTLAFQGINAKMHGAMDIAFTGNADVDFITGMIPHHEGAVDMAKTVLAFGKDPAVKTLAEDIIKAQETEIAIMRDWLKKNGR